MLAILKSLLGLPARWRGRDCNPLFTRFVIRYSWGSGANPWGFERDDQFSVPNHWDGMLEVVGVTGVLHLGQIQSGLRSAIRIAQVSLQSSYYSSGRTRISFHWIQIQVAFNPIRIQSNQNSFQSHRNSITSQFGSAASKFSHIQSKFNSIKSKFSHTEIQFNQI